MDRKDSGSKPVRRLTLLRWGTVVNMDGPLGRRMVGVYVRESIALTSIDLDGRPVPR